MRPRRAGNCTLTIFNKEELIGKREFRVKKVPDPVAKVAGKKSGAISKEELLEQERVDVVMEYFDFDLQYKVIEFTVSATIKGFVRNEPAKGNTFTQHQKNLIRSQAVNGKIYIEAIKAVGPDGRPRDLPAIVFLLSE